MSCGTSMQSWFLANYYAGALTGGFAYLLEIKQSPELAQTYFAEFIRLYEHYRARALWNIAHPATKGKLKKKL